MSISLSPEKVESLATQIDIQLSKTRTSQLTNAREVEPSSTPPLKKQFSEIEKITKEKPVSFLKRFREAAKQDVCEEGGILNAHWKKYKDLASKDVVESFGPTLVAMGFSGVLLEALVVAVGVTVLHIGLTAFCEEL